MRAGAYITLLFSTIIMIMVIVACQPTPRLYNMVSSHTGTIYGQTRDFDGNSIRKDYFPYLAQVTIIKSIALEFYQDTQELNLTSDPSMQERPVLVFV